MKNRQIFLWLLGTMIFILFTSCQDPYIPVQKDPPQSGTDTAGPSEETNSIDEPIQEYVLRATQLQYYNGSLYFYKGHSSFFLNQASGVFSRYNIETGNVTSVCPDPLCTHNTQDCPFAGRIPIFIVHGNTICDGQCSFTYGVGNSK